MKTVLLPLIIAAAAILPCQQAEAAKFGGFKPGYNFTLKVEEVISSKVTGFGTPQKAKIPSGLPKYKKGQKVTFKIGRKGILIAKDLAIPFTADAGTSNVYNKVITGSAPKTDTATVYKDGKNKAIGAAITYVRISGSAFNLSTYSLTYTLR